MDTEAVDGLCESINGISGHFLDGVGFPNHVLAKLQRGPYFARMEFLFPHKLHSFWLKLWLGCL